MSYLSGVGFEALTCITVPTILSYVVSYLWPVELLQDHLLHICLAKISTRIMIFSYYHLHKTLQYVQLSFVHQEVTKVVCQHILVSMLTVHMMPVPPQLRIMLLLEANLIEEVRRGSVRGHRGEEIRASRDGIQKDICGSLSVLNTTPQKKISKIFSPE